jgi:hypothetical protein
MNNMKSYQNNIDNNTITNLGLGISTSDNNNFGLGNNSNFGLGISTSDELLTSSKGLNSNLSKSKQVKLNLIILTIW